VRIVGHCSCEAIGSKPVARASPNALPGWIRPQLTKLVDAPPEGADWLHEIKFDGYRLHARLGGGKVTLLTRTGLDWTHKYSAIASPVASLQAKQAYLDGCGVRPDGTTSLGAIQAASDTGNSGALVFFLFDLLYLDGGTISAAPLIDRKARLQKLLTVAPPALQFSEHQTGLRAGVLCERRANCRSKGSSRSALTPRWAIAACGPKPSV